MDEKKKISLGTIICIIIILVILLIGGILLYKDSVKIAELEDTIEQQKIDIEELNKTNLNENTQSTSYVEENKEMDKGLEKAARIYLEIDDDCELTDVLLSRVFKIDLIENDIKIESLNGIDKFTNLESIRIGDCFNITDISPLTKLTQIREIDISHNYIEEIPDFSNCKKLEALYLPLNKIKDISPLKNVTSLKFLNLNSNYITSVEPLKNLENLEYLDINNNAILDWNTLNNNKSIQNALQWDFELTNKLEKEANSILNKIIKPEMTELEKEIVIYKYVIDNTEYNEDYRNQMPPGYRAICEKKGVCGEYAEAIAYLMNKTGLECICVGSDTHAWNMVKIDDVWYEIDALWDDSDYTEVDDWRYFNISRESLTDIDHKLDIPKRYPETNNVMQREIYIKAYNNII